MEDEEADAVERALTTFQPTVKHEQVRTREIQVAKEANFVERALTA